MNNYEEIIEQIHSSNMHKRESELNIILSKTHRLGIRITIAASLVCIVCLSLFIIRNTNNQPQPLEIAKVKAPNQHQNPDLPTVEPSEPQSTTYLPITHKDDNLTVVCQNNCDVEDVLQRFEQTLSSLN